MNSKILLLCLAALASAPFAHAKSCNNVNFPDQIEAAGTTLALNGLGLRQATMFKVNVYVAALYVPKPSRDAAAILDANGPARLVLHFVRDVGVGDLRDAWEEGFAKNAKAQLPALKDRIATLNSYMADMKTGKQIVFTYTPGTGVEVTVNGASKGIIKGEDFAKALWSVWLGAEPPNPEIKTGLLGGACG